MKPWKPKLAWLFLTMALGTAVLLPLIGTFGLWDPHEIRLADEARSLLKPTEEQQEQRVPSAPHIPLIAWSVQNFGTSEWGARLPMLVLGIGTLLVVYGIGLRVRGVRLGFLAAICVATCPLFIFSSRQLLSGIFPMFTGTVAAFGAIGILLHQAQHNRFWLLADALVLTVGTWLSYEASGLLVGPLVIATTLTVATYAAPAAKDTNSPLWLQGKRKYALGTLFGLASLCILVSAILAVYELVPTEAGKLGFLGKSLTAREETSAYLGGTWLSTSHAEVTFDWIINHVAFGMFPWSAIAPLAVLRQMTRPRGETPNVIFFVAWALFAYATCALWSRYVVFTHYVALPAIAIAIALWLDDLFETTSVRIVAAIPTPEQHPYRKHLDSRSGVAKHLPQSLAAIFIVAAVIQLARDILLFPDEISAVHSLSKVTYPESERLLLVAVSLFGTLAMATLAFVIGTRQAHPPTSFTELRAQIAQTPLFSRIQNWPKGTICIAIATRLRFTYEHFAYLIHRGPKICLGFALLNAMYLSYVFTPTLSNHFSYKNVFNSAANHTENNEPLGVMGIAGSGPEFYAQGSFEKLSGRGQLQKFLGRSERVLAIAPPTELCPLNQALGEGKLTYNVLDDQNSRFLLLTNKKLDAEADRNPLPKYIQHQEPKMDHRFDATWEDTIQLIGFDAPTHVKHGDTFEVTLYFRVLKRPRLPYKVFMHFDQGHSRFQGDHDPIDGICPPNLWRKGDYIKDTIEVAAGTVQTPTGKFQLHVGFFTGSAGRWKNMKVSSENGDKKNRVMIHTLHVK